MLDSQMKFAGQKAQQYQEESRMLRTELNSLQALFETTRASNLKLQQERSQYTAIQAERNAQDKSSLHQLEQQKSRLERDLQLETAKLKLADSKLRELAQQKNTMLQEASLHTSVLLF